ncbi:hypothetical protein N868_02400 [Cellulomonas carbonis T26]|uniref:Uncharacterized protein n=1 Tax=Cellulomonas carbonis T26 TaxID=947969 RepID=A0A0A0BN42_9CELL|nr:hypothetical protein N868_02400 [Cellulomonas carbonis T26]
MTVAVAGAVVATSGRDAGWFVVPLVGVPLVAAAGVLVVTLRRSGAAGATWSAAVVVLGWALVTGLGTGGWFAAPGLVLLAAAVATSSGPSTGSSASAGRPRPARRPASRPGSPSTTG